jgi:RNA polymerase sigma factor (TIGR02999 family)
MVAMPPEHAAPAEGRPAATSRITALLAAARGGNRAAADRVFALLYDELRRVASRQAGRFGGAVTLSTTALVHEAYLRLAGGEAVPANDRVHFFALAARVMRNVLIDHARAGESQKRGGGVKVVALEALSDQPREHGGPAAEELLALDAALARLEAVDPELERLVEWRFFAGLTLEEIAGMTGTSERTLKRDWAFARGFLMQQLGGRAAAVPP